MKPEKNIFRLFITVFAFCTILVFGMALSGCNDSDDNDSSTTTVAWYMDADGDGYGDPDISTQAETQPTGYVSDNTDCDDNDVGIHPSASDICGDFIDNDCDGSDPACDTTLFYKDADADGYSDGTTQEAVSQPTGYYTSSALISTWSDCDDKDAGIHPGATEACNDGKDNDCNGNIDCNDTACVNDASCDDDTAGVTVDVTYPIVDTGQTLFYDDTNEITEPETDDTFYGQDAQYSGNQASYTTSSDGLTVLDNVTGVIWTQTADWNDDGTIDSSDKFTYAEAETYVATLNATNYGGYSDWRVPAIKQLYSLIDFRGTDPNPNGTSTNGLTPFIDSETFGFAYGDYPTERIIDAQWVTSTLYTANSNQMFGVNFADGRIKGYGLTDPMGGEKTFYAFFCRGNTDYGTNEFTDNDDATVTDNATGLMWSQTDNAEAVNWEDALAWVQEKNDENYLGHDDWRLPNAKELQSIVDYTRSPDTTDSAAIDGVFECAKITNEDGDPDYGYYWASTTHRGSDGQGNRAVYVAFGRGLGSYDMNISDIDIANIEDVHGAGCQRSDPKDGDEADYSDLSGPQGDVRRVFNYVRCVRDVISNND